MKEELIEEVLRRVEQQLSKRPPALLLGEEPSRDLGFSYVKEGPYSAVVIASMSAAELLRFPDEKSLKALLEGKPVYLLEEGESWRRYAHSAKGELYSRLLSARRQMLRLGVQVMGCKSERLLTAHEVRRRLQEGLPIQGRLTPLAKDVLEGK